MKTRLIRQRLMRHRNQLLARYHDELQRADEIDKHESEDVERATEKWDVQTLASLGEADARTLGDVIAALRRLEDGTYGKCLTCEEPISDERLDALPTAQRCIECADESRPTRPVRARRTAKRTSDAPL
jgi:RNA polymerase-binding protein DksA